MVAGNKEIEQSVPCGDCGDCVRVWVRGCVSEGGDECCLLKTDEDKLNWRKEGGCEVIEMLKAAREKASNMVKKTIMMGVG